MIEDFWLIIAPILHSLLAFLKTPASYAIILALSAFLISLLGTRLVILALRKRTDPSG